MRILRHLGAGLLITSFGLLTSGRALASEIPRPDLGAVAPVVRAQIEALRAGFDELRQEGAGSHELLAEAAGRLGAVYHAHEFHLAAEAAYRYAHQLAPRDARWSYYLGILYLDVGREDDALASYRALLESHPADLPGLIRAGELLLRLGRPDDARPLFERALVSSPGSAAALYGLGRVAAAGGDARLAALRFERVLELQPEARGVHYPLALAHRQLGDLAAARHHLELRGETDVDFPDPRLDRLASLAKVSAVNVVVTQADQPGAVSARELAGYAVAHLVDTPGAIEALAAAEAAAPGRVARARLHFVIATLARLQESSARELEHLEAAVELAPDFLEALFELAGWLARNDRPESAIDRYSAVLELEPDHRGALEGRAETRIQLGRDGLAVADLRQLAALAPAEGTPRLRLAMVHHRLGGSELAEPLYREALELGLDPRSEALARGNIGRLMAERGDSGAAVEQLEEASRLDPDSIPLALGLADALARVDRFDAAARHYAAVVARQPGNAPARIGEISALIFARRFPEAGERLETAHLADPDSDVVSHLLARFLAASPSRELRDGERALALARRLFDQRRTLLHGETVAMALAESGRLSEAAALQGDLVAAAEARHSARAAERLRANLELYRAGRPCCAQPHFAVLLPTAENAPGAG